MEAQHLQIPESQGTFALLRNRPFVRCVVIAAGLLCPPLVCHGQAPNVTSATTAMSQAAQAFSKGVVPNGITLTGSAHWIAGGDSEMGNVTLAAHADGSYSVALDLAKGARTESQTAFSAGQSCSWSGPDGVAHPASDHNCLLGTAWFLPEVALFGGHQPTGMATSLVEGSPACKAAGRLNLRQQSTLPSASSASMGALYAHLSVTDICLDAGTYLPSSLSYATHPDANAAMDIPVRIQFSDYQVVNGFAVPFHIERYVNGVLSLEITVTQAAVNQ